MTEYTKLIERLGERYGVPDLSTDQLLNRRDRKRRNQRIVAGVVGIGIFVAAVWIVTSVASLDRSEKSVVPGESGTTGPSETYPDVTAVPKTDYLLDLETGEMTPLPKPIAGAEDNDHVASPDGAMLAYTSQGDNGKSQVFVANLDGTGIEQVTHDLEKAFSPTWSPDGSKIAFIGSRGGGERNVFVLDLATGASTQVTSRTVGAPAASKPASFTPDGSSLVYGGSDPENTDHVQVLIVPITGGRETPLIEGEGDDEPSDPQLSPDGSLLSYLCAQGLCLANGDGTGARVLAPSSFWDQRWSPDGTRIVGWQFHLFHVFVVDSVTGEVSFVAFGESATWLDDHTLIVERTGCYDTPPTGKCEG